MIPSLFAFTVAGLMSLATSRHDVAPELVEAKTVQRFDVAVAVTLGAESQRGRWPGSLEELVATELAIGQGESTFALHIGQGKCERWECDTRNGVARSVSFWQFKGKPEGATPLPIWEAAKTDVPVAAKEAARLITNARLRCSSLERAGHDWVPMTIASYAGRGCRGWFPRIEERVATYRRLMGRRASS